ncbi:MAG: hypothetical protein ACJ796_04705 [Gemmatimonadaceae bacterium]
MVLCYLWGIVLLTVAIAAASPMFSGHGFVIAAALFPLVVLIVAVAYFVTGYFIHRRRRLGAWLGITVAIVTALLQFVMHLDFMWINLTPAWLVVDAVLLVVLLANWRRFDQAPR